MFVVFALRGPLRKKIKRMKISHYTARQGPMILAHQLASGPDAFGQNLPRPSRSVFYNMVQAFFGKTELNQMWEVRSGPIPAAC